MALVNNMPPQTGIGRYTANLAQQFQRGLEIQASLFWVNRFKWGIGQDERRVFLGPPLAHVETLLNYVFASKQLPRRFDIYHVTSQMIASFATENKPSVVTFADIPTSGANVSVDPQLYSAGIYPRQISIDITSTKLYHRFLRRNLDQGIRESERIICISSYVADHLVKVYGVSSKKIKVIPLGVDPLFFHPRSMLESRRKLNLPMSAKLILHVGSELPMKNVGSLVRAFSEVTKQFADIYLVRVGKPSKEIAHLISQLGITQRVIYRQAESNNEVPIYYNACDLLAFPSVYEGFGLPLLEAMASGCPIVAGDAAAIPEVLGDAGIRINPLDFGELAHQLYVLLSESETRAKLLELGTARANLFTWEETMRQTVDVYNTLR